MDGYPEPVLTAYKALVDKKSKKPPLKQQRKPSHAQSSKQCKQDKGQKREQKRDQTQEKPKTRSKDKTLSAVGKSTKEDVCTCVRVLSEYIKEAVKLVICKSPCRETRFGPMFCELGDNTVRLLQDFYNFVAILLKCLLSKAKK